MKSGRCNGEAVIKNGQQRGQQRYKCKSCAFSFTKGYRGKAEALKQQALKLYLEGMGFGAIGRILDVSNVAVLNWVQTYGQGAEKVLEEQPGKQVRTAELEELPTYTGSKKTIAGSG